MKTEKRISDWTEKQPNTVFVGDIEVPSYQNFWERTMKIENKIAHLKIGVLVLAIVNTVLFALVIAIVSKLLK